MPEETKNDTGKKTEAKNVGLSAGLGSALPRFFPIKHAIETMAREARIYGGEWTRKEMMDYLEITESQKTNDELWNDVVDYKEKRLKEIFVSASA